MRERTISVSLTWPFQRVNAALGMSAEEAQEGLARYGVPLTAFADPSTRVPLRVALAELTRSEQRHHRTDLAILAAEAAEAGDFGAVELAARAAGTVGEALGVLSRAHELLADGVHLAVERREGRAVVRFWVDRDIPASPALAEFGLLALLRIGTRYCGPLQVRAVRFAHGPVPHAAVCARAFGAEVHFNAGESSLDVDGADLDLPLRTANPMLARALADRLTEVAERTSRHPLLGRLEEAVGRDLENGVPSVREAARRVATSERSLHRKLREAGTTYGQLCDAIRTRVALRLLDTSDLSVKEVARAVGFADVSTFHRAFKRWTGTTPGQRRDAPRDSVLPGRPDADSA
ncbi:MAG: AraC family transcriptional regulator ligand-binding domain-containing protein [Deltaproteobacteria bacterium]|nr:AraC family transcriptional regulator ligand-binding domain-containing protein [Deltaproteobacteria bacterium]